MIHLIVLFFARLFSEAQDCLETDLGARLVSVAYKRVGSPHQMLTMAPLVFDNNHPSRASFIINVSRHHLPGISPQ